MHNCIQPSGDNKIKTQLKWKGIAGWFNVSWSYYSAECSSWWKPRHLEGRVKWDSRGQWKDNTSMRRHQTRQPSSLHTVFYSHAFHYCCFLSPGGRRSPWPYLCWVSDPIPLRKDVGTAQPSAVKGAPPPHDVWAPGFMWGANTSKRTQLLQALHSFSSLNTARPPERHSGRLQSTAQVGRDLFWRFKMFLSLRAAYYNQVSPANTLPLFLCTEPPCGFTSPVFKVQGKRTRHSPKPWEMCSVLQRFSVAF